MTLLAWTWLGLSAGALGGLGAVGSLAIVALYFLRVERRRLPVAFVELFESWTKTTLATAFRSKTTRWLSLLVQLLLLWLLLLALADPRPDEAGGDARSLVVVLDVSASMSAADVTPTRFDKARDRVREFIDGLGPRDRMLLLEMGARARPVTGFTSDRALLGARLAELEVLDTRAAWGEALSVALDALGTRSRPEIVLVSDGALPLEETRGLDRRGVPVRFESMAPGASAVSNVAISAFAARRYPLGAGAFEVIVELSSTDEKEVEVELTLTDFSGAAERVLEVRRAILPPRGSVESTLADLAGATTARALRASIRRLDGKKDVLVRDDVAFAVVPRPTESRVLIVGAPNQFLEAALLVDEGIHLERTDESGYARAGHFDFTLFDGVFPPRRAETGPALYLGVPAAGTAHPLAAKKRIEEFGFDAWDKKDPVFRFLDPYDIQVLEGATFEPLAGDRVLGRSDAGPILVSGSRAEGRFLALGFDPKKSDFVLRAEFPLFLLNAMQSLVPATDEARAHSFTTGTTWHFDVPRAASAGPGRALVRGPLGGREREVSVPLDEDRGVFFGERAGIFEVKSGNASLLVAASLHDAVESSVAPRREIDLDSQKLTRVAGLEPRSSVAPWIWLVLAALVVSAIEWFSYHRRWTV